MATQRCVPPEAIVGVYHPPGATALFRAVSVQTLHLEYATT